MIVRFNSLNRAEKPLFTLCNPGSVYTDGKLSNVVGVLTNHEAEECVFNFNQTSELNFRIYSIPVEDDDTANEHLRFMYDAIKNKRLIFMNDIGYFIIDDVNEQHDNGNDYKDVSAKSVDAELEQKNIPYIADGTYRFSTSGSDTGIIETIVSTLPLWTVDHIDSSVASKYRTFEDVDTSLNCLSFLIEKVQEAYECIILFDTINRIINIYDQSNYVHRTGVHLTQNDVINSLKIKEQSDDLYTAITVSGDSDVLIADVNPLGTNTIYNYTYYLDWMTDNLKNKVIAWQNAINTSKVNYYNYNLDLYTLKQTAYGLEADIQQAQTQKQIYERCLEGVNSDDSKNIVAVANDELDKYGGVPVDITKEVSQIKTQLNNLIASCNTTITSLQGQLTTVNSQITSKQAQINNIRNSLSMSTYFTSAELEELANYTFEGTYKDEYVVITDVMSYSEKFAQMKILYDRAEKQLEIASMPTQEFEIDTESILFEKDFQFASEQLETGCLINVEVKEDDVAELFLSCIKVNYDDHSLNMTFGNRYNKFDPKTLFQNVLGNVNKTANTLSFVKDTVYPIKQGALNVMSEAIQSSRDLTMAWALASESAEVVIDSTGYTGKRKDLNNGGYYPEQIKITNNNIVFTDDAWQTSKAAIGKISLGDNVSKYGINAQVLIGDIIIGNELHIKDSQGQDVMTVIDGRISTEVTNVKAAAAAGTYEYYDPANSSWSEKNNVDYFGYGLSQDEKETDTGVKATGNTNKYFLNKHNGNLYKSNGTKWVFQKTLSPKFDNYSTITYTDGKASTAESNAKTYAEGQASTAQTNAINNATQQVNSAKATIASSTLKYDETGITVNYYGYGAPTEIAGATQGNIYLDQNDGFYYTKGSGSTWTKSGSALPIYADQKANTAKTEAISTASADATAKANTAEGNAKTAAANAMSKYDEGNLTISYYGFGAPRTVAGSSQGQIYLDQNTGFYYTKGSGSTWTKSSTALPLYADQKAIEAYNNAVSHVTTYYTTTDDMNTLIEETEQEIKMTAARAVQQYEIPAGITINYSSYGTPSSEKIVPDASGMYYLDQDTGDLYVSTGTTYNSWSKDTEHSPLPLLTKQLDSKIDQTARNITQSVSATYSTKTETANAITTVATATNKYDTTGITVNFYGYGVPTTIAGSSQGSTYLDQKTGYLYTRGSAESSWTETSHLTLLTTKIANDAKDYTDSQITTTTTNMNTKIDETAGHIISSANARLEQTIGYEVSKNMLELTANSTTKSGITFTVDRAAGTVTVNGTCTASSYTTLTLGNVVNNGTDPLNLYLSGGAENGSRDLYLYSQDISVDPVARPKKWDGETSSSSLTDPITSTEIQIPAGHTVRAVVLVRAGTTVENEVFKPMIRDGVYEADPTFEPYREAQTVQSQISEANSKIIQTAHGITQTVAASNAVEYIIPSGVTVNYHGYGFGQTSGGAIDYTMTDTGISAVGISGQTFLNQSNGILYTSDGTTWANSQQQLSTKFSDYKTAAQTTSEINQTTNNIKLSVLSTTAGAMGKYDTTGVTVNFYGYGVPTTVAGSEPGSTYLDQETGFLYTRGSGATETWTKTSALTLDAVSKANTAQTNAINSAKNYTDGELTNYTTTTDMNTTINSAIDVARESVTLQSKALVEATVGYMNKNLIPITMNSGTYKSGGANLAYTVDKTAGTITFNGTSRTDTTNINLNFYTDSTGTISGNYYITGGYSSKCYVRVYDSGNGWCKKWSGTSSMTGSTSESNSQEVQLVAGHNNLFRVVITPNTTLTNAVVKPMLRVPDITDTTFVPYKSTVQRQIDDTNASIVVESNRITSTVADSTSKYDTTDVTIHYYGFGLSQDTTKTDTGILASVNLGKYFLNQTNGYVYVSDGTYWVEPNPTIHLDKITDKLNSKVEQTADGIRQEVFSTIGYSIDLIDVSKLTEATSAGITYTRQNDGSYILNGTAGSSGSGIAISTSNGNIPSFDYGGLVIESGTYTLQATGTEDVTIRFARYGGSTTPYQVEIIAQANVYDTEFEFTYDSSYVYFISIYVSGNVTLNNFKLYPTFYSGQAGKTVKSLIDQRADEIALSVTSKNGGYNLTPVFTPRLKTGTSGNVTITKQNDGSYIVNGTTGNSIVSFMISTTTGALPSSVSGNAITQNGTYTIRGTGDSRIGVWFYNGSYSDVAKGVTDVSFTVNNASSVVNYIKMQVAKNETYNNVKIYPLVYNSSDAEKLGVADAALCSRISVSSDQITLSSAGRLIITAGNFKLDNNGTVTVTSGIFKTSNYSAASGSTPTVGGKIDLNASLSSEYLFDTANFKITGTGDVTATGANLTNCSIIGGSFVVSGDSAESYIDLVDNSAGQGLEYRTTVYPGEIHIQNAGTMTRIDGASVASAAITAINAVTTPTCYTHDLRSNTEGGDIRLYSGMAIQSGCGLKLANKMAFWIYNNEVAIGVDTLPLRFYGTNVMLQNGTAVTSDARSKHNIESLDNRYLEVVKNIEPKRFQYISNPLDRYHAGYIAQEVKSAMEKVGISESEMAAFVDVRGDGSELALRYGEFIPMLHKWIKEIDDRLKAIERKEYKK